MDETTTLTADEITVTAVAGADGAEFTCCNQDPRDACFSFYDADPTNGRW
jgi:hypothetical protein